MREYTCHIFQMGVGMTRLLIAIFCLLPLAALGQRTSFTADTTFYVDPAGDDARDCRSAATSCKTMQATWTKVLRDYDTRGYEVFMQLADGVYTSGLNIVDQPLGVHLLQINGNCTGTPYAANRSNVIVRPPSGTTAFWAQDTAILVVNCLRVEGAGVIGFQARQHVIMDINWIDFGPLSVGMKATDHSIINFAGDNWISGGMSSFIQAFYHSHVRVTAGSTNIVKTPVSITYFVQSYSQSYVEFEGGSSFMNWQNVTGNPYYVWRGGAFAANGIPVPGSSTAGGTNVQGTGVIYP